MGAQTTGGHADEDLVGTTFAGREVDDVLARDLVSTVYRARHPEDGSTVALRVVAADLCGGDGDDGRLYEGFKRYASAALTLAHPNVPTVEEVGEHQGRGYVVTSDVDSMPFGAYLDQHGPLGLDAALPLFEQIADVLDAGQRAGVTHGAVNPLTLRVVSPPPADGVPSILLTGHGLGALLGLRLRRDRGDLDIVDDLLYVGPEQLREQTSTGRTDQYAMTCALVHAATGSPPFVRDTVNALFGAHLFVEPDFDAQLSARGAILKGLAKEPRDRYATCGQLIADIRRAERSAANRRHAAARRRTATVQRPPSGVDSARPAPSVLYERGDVRHAGTHADDQSPPDHADTAARLDAHLEEPSVRPPDHADTAARPDADLEEPSVRPPDHTHTAARLDADLEEPSVRPPAPPVEPQVDDRPDDNSATPVHDGPELAYASKAQEAAEDPAAGSEDDPAEALPLSEVLSRRSQRPDRTTWRRPGVVLALIIIALLVGAALLWFSGV